MRDQITAAVGFILCLVRNSHEYGYQRLHTFKDVLSELLYLRFRNHWYPENPLRGHAYRCIRINRVNSRDEILEQSCVLSGIDYGDFISRLPRDLTIWIDPDEVSYRLGERRGQVCNLVSFDSSRSSSD